MTVLFRPPEPDVMMQFIVPVVVCTITGILAQRKGYSFLIWFFSAGAIGLIILAFLPPATTPRQTAIGNLIGAGITLAVIVLLAVAMLNR